MNRNFKPAIESLEERMVMDAAGTHVLSPDLVAPVAVDREHNASNTNSYITNDYSLTIAEGISGSHLHKVGPGHLILPTANTYAGHELGHALGFRHEHTRPSAAADDVWIDGKIITADTAMAGHPVSADWYFMVSEGGGAAIGGAGDDLLLGGERWDTKGGAGLDVLIANTGGDRLDATGHIGGATSVFGDGSVRFVGDGISSSTAPGFKSSVDNGGAAAPPAQNPFRFCWSSSTKISTIDFPSEPRTQPN